MSSDWTSSPPSDSFDDRTPESLRNLSQESLDCLNPRQTELFLDDWQEFRDYLKTKGKDPDDHEGYAQSNLDPITRRVFQVFEHEWNGSEIVLDLSEDAADRFVEALKKDEFRKRSGEPYAEASKRKFVDALEAYFRYKGTDWEPDHSFSDNASTNESDPFTLDERKQLFNAALRHKSPPTYSNLSPEERDRWKGYIAEYMGKPKSEVSPEDWEALQKSWKVPALIATDLDAGWRSAMVGRLKVDYVNLEENLIVIPPEAAVKNDSRWEVTLTDKATKILERWLEQRSNKTKYDDSDRIWLNRKGNPYGSKNLNDLLGKLIEEAGIDQQNRKLTWHSIRHSTGRYIYDQQQDLKIVAQILRHKSLESASIYAEPTPETKKRVLEGIDDMEGVA